MSVVLDLSGRPFLGYDLDFRTERIGSYEVQLVEHFFQSLVNTSGMTLHIRQVRAVCLGIEEAPGDLFGLVGSGLRLVPLSPRRPPQDLCLAPRSPSSAPATNPSCECNPSPLSRPVFFENRTSQTLGPIPQLAGVNSHHIVEAAFKAFARALRHACEADPRRQGSIASSKGVLTQQ